MRILPALLLFGLLALAASSAAFAQTVIRLGATLEGTLSEKDPMLDDSSHYDLYTFMARSGQRVRITLRSEDFDTYLVVGQMDGDDLDILESDDDGGGGTDSQITFTIPNTTAGAALFTIRANSLSAGETGDYTISLAEAPAPTAQGPQEIEAGTYEGMLEDTDQVAPDDSYYDEYVYEGTDGEIVVITMRSEDFDTYLTLRACDSEDLLESNDDGPDMGTHSQITLKLPGRGAYCIRANSLSAGETGDYTLTIESE